MAMTYSAAGRAASHTIRSAAHTPLRQAFSNFKQQRAGSQAFPTCFVAPSMQLLPLQSISASALHSPSGFKKPEIIEWQEDTVNNRATLIGIIIREVRIRYLDSGKIVANSSLKLTRLSRESWFYLEFWDDLAEIAAAHLKVNEEVFVAGSVWPEKVQGKDGLEKVFAKVVVEDLKFVKANSYAKRMEEFQDLDAEGLWEDLFGNPTEWFDCRGRKLNERYPDFVHMITNKALWLDARSTPKWVQERLEKGSDIGFIPKSTLEEKWKDFFADPSRWWDNRPNKKLPQFPDFKHKVTRESLWIDNRKNPDWVKAKLADLDSKAKETE